MDATNATRLIDALSRHGETIRSLFEGVSEDDLRARPAPGKWSMLEVLGHLLDEERDDFRQRLRLTLEDPELPWPAIDPEGWARERSYNERRVAEALAEHRQEREHSLSWLRELAAPDWRRAHVHPTIGSLAAGDLLAAWVAHDLLHLRQLVNLKLARLALEVAPYSIRYATS